MNDIVLVDKKESRHFYFFNKNNGLSIRAEYEGEEEPFWSIEGPELIDISITNYCEKECSFCYRNSSVQGKHMSLEDFKSVLEQLIETHTYQIAIGGGNPNQHPNFVEMLRMAREDYGVIPSYTTNGTGLSREVLKASKDYCGAVAVSYYEPIHEFLSALEKLKSSDIKTNIHFLLTSESIPKAINILENSPQYLEGVNAIIFLNYKPVGKNPTSDLLLKNTPLLNDFINKVKNHDMRKYKIGFDSCSISGIVENLRFDSRFIESCESGRFSAFISEDMKLYPCSFMDPTTNGINLKEIRLHEAWVNAKEFKDMRSKLNNNACKNKYSCELQCHGGCPIYEEINLCRQNSSDPT